MFRDVEAGALSPPVGLVCMVAHQAQLSGADRSLLETASLLRGKGHRVLVLVPADGPLLKELDAQRIPYLKWRYYWWLHRPGLPVRQRVGLAIRNLYASVRLLSLARRLRQLNTKVVYTNTLATAAGAQLSLILGVPHVWHVREFVEEDHQLAYMLGKRSSLRFARLATQVFIFNSEAVLRHFRPFFFRRALFVAHQAVPMRRAIPDRSPPTAAQLHAVLVGRLHPKKGQALAIEATRQARIQGVPVVLTIVGDDPSGILPSLESQIKRAGLTDFVHLLPFDEDVLGLVAECDVALMCSTAEAFGRVTIEAMKLGLPVIGARSGATQDLISEGETGWLFEPGNPQDLASRLRLAYENQSRLSLMGASARAWAELQFNEARYIEIVELAIEAATKARKNPTPVTNPRPSG